MITRIEATRCRCFDKLDVELGDFRALVCANASGKITLRHMRPSLRQLLAQGGRKPPGAAKPLPPKAVIQALIHANRARPPMVVYSGIAVAMATAGCVDPSFHRVRDALRAWFPAEGA